MPSGNYLQTTIYRVLAKNTHTAATTKRTVATCCNWDIYNTALIKFESPLYLRESIQPAFHHPSWRRMQKIKNKSPTKNGWKLSLPPYITSENKLRIRAEWLRFDMWVCRKVIATRLHRCLLDDLRHRHPQLGGCSELSHILRELPLAHIRHECAHTALTK